MVERLLCVCVTSVMIFGAGCSISKSSSSPFRWSSQSSKSSSSPFRSSSESSGGEDEKDSEEETDETSYERDVRETTESVVEVGGDAAQILRAIGPVASNHGVTDWENDPATFTAIGRGLGTLPLDDFDRMSEGLTTGSDVRKNLLLEGYTSGH